MQNKKIVIIGNNNGGKPLFDGGRIKTRLYFQLLNKEGFDSLLIDIHKWYLRFFKIVRLIKREIKNKSRIVIMAGPKGCRFFIPLVNKLNKKKMAEVVFCPLGIGTLDYIVKDLSCDDLQSFMTCKSFFGKSDSKMSTCLKQLSLVIVQSNVLKRCYEEFYSLNNVVVLNNFRMVSINDKPKIISKGNILKLCFLSRVCENKGIIDLMNVCKDINSEGLYSIKLDIYGTKQFSNESVFNSLLDENINYLGCAKQSEVLQTIEKYDLFALPTKYHAEGIPGSAVESLISGTPVLASSFNQVNEIVNDNIDGFVFHINDVNSLKEKLLYLCDNKNLLEEASNNALKSGLKYTYEFNRQYFLKYFCGESL